MEIKDKSPIPGKFIIIVVVLALLVFGGYKGYEWARAEVSAQIEARAAEAYHEGYTGGYDDGYVAGLAIGTRKQKIITEYTGQIGYIAGYYANELGEESPHDIEYFEEHYQEVKQYIPEINYAKTMLKLDEDGQYLTVVQMLELMKMAKKDGG